MSAFCKSEEKHTNILLQLAVDAFMPGENSHYVAKRLLFNMQPQTKVCGSHGRGAAGWKTGYFDMAIVLQILFCLQQASQADSGGAGGLYRLRRHVRVCTEKTKVVAVFIVEIWQREHGARDRFLFNF